MKKRPVIILMTATITPPKDCPDLARKDPAMRMNDYINALNFYLDLPSQYCDRIIFAENSDTNLEPIQSAIRLNTKPKHVELISFPQGNSFPPEYGKGYGEMLLMDYAMNNSKMISDQDIIWKATGRLILDNLAKIIQTSPQDYDVYCDLHSDYKLLGLVHFFDPRFYSFTRYGYDTFFRPHTNSLQGAHIEHYFYNVLIENLGSNRIIPRFSRVPMIRGIVGSSNKDYFTFKKIIQRNMQQAARYISPWIWL